MLESGSLLFPNFIVRSSGGLCWSLLGEEGAFCTGFEPLNQTSGRALGPGWTVARCLDLLSTALVEVGRCGNLEKGSLT